MAQSGHYYLAATLSLRDLTPAYGGAYCSDMENAEDHLDIPEQIKALDARLTALLKRAGQIRRQSEKMAAERARLMIVQEQARARIKAMIAELKSLERHT